VWPSRLGQVDVCQKLVLEGYVRLSLDEVIWQRLEGRDPGKVLDGAAFAALKEEVRLEQRAQLVELMRAGIDVVVDYTFWSRDAREDYKSLIERHGGRWQLVYVRASRSVIERRLQARNAEDDADAVTVSDTLLDDYLAKFQEPVGEGEQVVEGSL
jgi:predicted kinase